MRARTLTSCFTIVALVAGALVLTPAVSPGYAAEVSCHKWVATNGADGNAGTEANPYRSLDKLVDALDAGQTGCIAAGTTYYALDGNGVADGGHGTPARPITITSGPGGTAAVRGSLWFTVDTHDIVFENLRFEGSYKQDGTPSALKNVHILLFGDRITFRNNEVSNPNGIGLQVGNSNVPDSSDDVIIENNRFTRNGTNPDLVWTAADSGAHGVYVQHSKRIAIHDNIFDGNKWRGLQFWPTNDRALVEQNLFVGNATHINLGYDDPGTPANELATNTVVRKNIFTARVTDYWPDDNPAQVFGVNTTGGTFGNLVNENCYQNGDAFTYGSGFAVGAANVSGTPSFENAAVGDFRLDVGGGCLGHGPAHLQPGYVDPGDGDGPPPASGMGRPDLAIRVPGGSWLGSSVFNHTGAGQTVGLSVRVGETARVELRGRAVGDADARWVLAAAPWPSGHAGSTHRWFWDGRDRTALVNDGSYIVNVSAAAAQTGSFTVRPSAAVVGKTLSYHLHAIDYPLAAPQVKDVVTIRVTVKPAAPKPAVTPIKKPNLRGTSKVGRVLILSTGRWSSGTKVTYRWRVGGKTIAHAKKTLKLKRAWLGKRVSVKVTAKASAKRSYTVTLSAKTRVRKR